MVYMPPSVMLGMYPWVMLGMYPWVMLGTPVSLLGDERHPFHCWVMKDGVIPGWGGGRYTRVVGRGKYTRVVGEGGIPCI